LIEAALDLNARLRHLNYLGAAFSIQHARVRAEESSERLAVGAVAAKMIVWSTVTDVTAN
jgi:hypothetical protein